MSKYQYIIWDWNGTLINDIKTAVEAVNDTMDVFDRPHISVERYYKLMESDVRGFYEQLFDFNVVPYERLTAYFSMFYDQRIKSARLMDDVLPVIKKLNSMGIVQIIASASHKDKVKRDAAKHKIDSLFSYIIGAENNLALGKRALIESFIEKHSIPRDKVLMVGDLLHDAQIADELNVEHVIIPRGHQSYDFLASNNVNLISGAEDILKLV